MYILQAVRKLLPNERLSLPAKTKQCWHLDKQSLRGIKRQRQEAAAEPHGCDKVQPVAVNELSAAS